ncbi:hypothetical protein RSAG8_05190, partial [Rhizoctonia solani AG-8 WAC10335]
MVTIHPAGSLFLVLFNDFTVAELPTLCNDVHPFEHLVSF